MLSRAVRRPAGSVTAGARSSRATTSPTGRSPTLVTVATTVTDGSLEVVTTSGVTESSRTVSSSPSGAAPAAGSGGPKAARGRLMIVENSEATAAKLRKFFTDLGFRVLETESPQRALARFSGTPLPADGLLLSAVHLGSEAVEAFNELSQDPFLAAVPAMLLLGKGQDSLADQAVVGPKRVVVKTPIDTKSLQSQLASLFGGRDA